MHRVVILLICFPLEYYSITSMAELHLDFSTNRPSIYDQSIIIVLRLRFDDHTRMVLKRLSTRKDFNLHAREVITRHGVESNVSCFHVMTQGVMHNGVQI